MRKKWNLIVDVAECHNCNNCFISCKDEYVDNDIPGYSAPQPLHGHKWINILTKERGNFPMVEVSYVPTMCNHCDNAPCVKTGGGAVKKRDDGIVIIDPQLAIGRKDIVNACPYGAIWWNEERQLPQAWTFDAHLLDRGWEVPRCVQSCPTGALKSLKVSDDEMEKIVGLEKLRPLEPAHHTRPRVHYKNLHLYDHLFICGSVVGKKAGLIECVTEAKVELLKEGKVTRTAVSDAFGDFKFDSLMQNSGHYEVRVSHPYFGRQSVAATLAKDCIVLSRITLN